MAEEEEEGGAEEGGGGSKLPLIIGGVVGLIVIAVAVWFFMFSGGDEEEEMKGELSVEETTTQEHVEAPLFLDLGSRVVNLKNGRRYLKTKIQLMIADPKVLEYLSFRILEVQDIILSDLQELTVEEIATKESREELKAQLIRSIKKTFPSKPNWDTPDPIRKLLFEEFIIQ